MNRSLMILGVAVTVGLFSETVQAASQFRIEQQDGSGVFQPIGHVSSFAAPGDTIESFYGYDRAGTPTTSDDGFHGRAAILANSDLSPNVSHLFLLQASDGLGLFVVHNKMDAGSGGQAEMSLTFDRDITLVVEDDEGSRPDDEFDVVATAPSSIDAQWSWGGGFSDGLAVNWGAVETGDLAELVFTDLDGADDPTPDKAYQTFDGLSDWTFLDGNGAALDLALTADRTVRIVAVPSPEAGVAGLAMLGGLIGVSVRKRRQAHA